MTKSFEAAIAEGIPVTRSKLLPFKQGMRFYIIPPHLPALRLLKVSVRIGLVYLDYLPSCRMPFEDQERKTKDF